MGRRGRNQLRLETRFFVTTTIVDHALVFANEDYCKILIRNIRHYQQRYRFTILGYVLMPSHFHRVVEVDPAFGTISDIMRDIKKHCAWDLLEALRSDRRNDLIRIFEDAASECDDQRLKVWMDRFDAEVIRNEDMLRTKLEYIRNNPVKAGLVAKAEEYRFSSARNYISNDHSILRVKTDWY